MLATKYAYTYSWFPSNEHLIFVDNVQQFVTDVKKFVCIIFCSYCNTTCVINLCTICVSENES